MSYCTHAVNALVSIFKKSNPHITAFVHVNILCSRTSCCSVMIVTEATTCTAWALPCLNHQRVCRTTIQQRRRRRKYTSIIIMCNEFSKVDFWMHTSGQTARPEANWSADSLSVCAELCNVCTVAGETITMSENRKELHRALLAFLMNPYIPSLM